MNTEGPSADLTPDELPVEAPVVEAPAAPEVVAQSPAAYVVPGLDDSSLYIHRELSQLKFNIRVLE